MIVGKKDACPTLSKYLLPVTQEESITGAAYVNQLHRGVSNVPLQSSAKLNRYPYHLHPAKLSQARRVALPRARVDSIEQTGKAKQPHAKRAAPPTGERGAHATANATTYEETRICQNRLEIIEKRQQKHKV